VVEVFTRMINQGEGFTIFNTTEAHNSGTLGSGLCVAYLAF